MAPTSSSIEIQLCHCVPEPILLPSPNLNSGSCFFSAPPSADSTMPVRRWTTRDAGRSSAGAVAASHCAHRSLRNPEPAGRRLVEFLVAA